MKVTFANKAQRDSLIKFLLALGYKNGGRTTFEDIDKGIRYAGWPVLFFDSRTKLIDFYSAPDEYTKNWLNDAVEIMASASAEAITMNIGDYTAIVDPVSSTVQVGCQTIHFDTVEALHKLIQEVKQ